MLVAAIDIGGTFTDLMAFDGRTGRFVQAKSLTTPAPRALLAQIERASSVALSKNPI
jgi:N-methylhydantoinase A/oxoprolinase/acetone carboxylase beta subunit